MLNFINLFVEFCSVCLLPIFLFSFSSACTFSSLRFFYKAKEKEKDMMKDVLSNVDSDGSTLLHLAVDSGSSEVSIARSFK